MRYHEDQHGAVPCCVRDVGDLQGTIHTHTRVKWWSGTHRRDVLGDFEPWEVLGVFVFSVDYLCEVAVADLLFEDPGRNRGIRADHGVSVQHTTC